METPACGLGGGGRAHQARRAAAREPLQGARACRHPRLSPVTPVLDLLTSRTVRQCFVLFKPRHLWYAFSAARGNRCKVCYLYPAIHPFAVYNSVTFSPSTTWCSRAPNAVLEYCHHPSKRPFVSLDGYSLASALGNAHRPVVSVSLSINSPLGHSIRVEPYTVWCLVSGFPD